MTISYRPWQPIWLTSLILMFYPSPSVLAQETAQPAQASPAPSQTVAPLPSPPPTSDPLLLPVKLPQGQPAPWTGFLLHREALELERVQATDLDLCNRSLATERAREPKIAEKIVEKVPQCPTCPPPPPPPSPWPDRLAGAGAGALLTGLAILGVILATR